MNPNEVVEHAFDCPYCGEIVTVLLDPSVAHQSYVEDCEVCCRPIELGYSIEAGLVLTFDARRQE